MLVNYVPRVPNAADFAYQGGVPLCVNSITGDLYVMLTGVAPYNTIQKVSGSGGTVTSVAALTIGTTGTDLTSSVANGTTTPVITLNVPTASATNRGALSAADWVTFNAKQAAISFGTGVLTALGVNVGTAGSVVINGGVLGTPSSGTATNLTGTATALNIGGNAATASAVAVGGITGLGTGVATALAVNVGSAGAFVTFNGAGGTPSSMTATNLSGTAASLTAGTATNLSGGSVTLGASSTLTFGSSAYVKAGSTFGVLINNDTDTVNLYGFPNSGTGVRWYSYGAGTATFSANGTITSVSDETYKIKDGTPDDPVSMLMKLTPGYCYWKDKETMGPQRELMFYAQNVHEAIGEEAAPTPIEALDKEGNPIGRTNPWGYYDRSVLAVTVLALQKSIQDFSAYKMAHQ